MGTARFRASVAVIAPSFGNIFYSNALRNGLLPVALAEEDCESIADEVEASQGAGLVTVDLEANEIVSPSGRTFRFSVPELYRHAMLDALIRFPQRCASATTLSPTRSAIAASAPGRTSVCRRAIQGSVEEKST